MTLLAFFTGILLMAFGNALGVETLVMGALGAFGTFIIQGIKNFVGTTTLEGTKALNLTMVVSIALATLGAFATDVFLNVAGEVTIASIINGVFIVFGVATIAYKYLLSQDAPMKLPKTLLT